MKKVIFGVFILLGMGLSQLNAQTISTGFKVNADLSGLSLKKVPDTKSKSGLGASLGGFMKVEFSENFAVQPELLFKLRNSKLEIFGENASKKNDYQYFGLEVPVYALGQFPLGNGKFYGGVGPYVGYGISAKFKEGGKTDNLYKEEALMKRFDFGAGALIGYEFSNKMQVNAGYQMGLVNLLKGGGDVKFRNYDLSVGIGYRF